MKKIFVTGAGGFIGSHLVETLVKSNYQVKALVKYNKENSYGWIDKIDQKIKSSVEIIAGDVQDTDLMVKCLKDVSTVFHLAALISIPYSYLSPRSYVITNVSGTLNILEAFKSSKADLFVNTSTSEVYGSAQYSPIDEMHPLNAQSPYAATKIAADQIALSYHKSFNLPITVIRPFNTFGPRQSLRAAIPTIITQCLINPKNIKLGNLNTKRDFTYVEDTARGFLKCINNKKCIGQVINLGTGYAFAINDVLNLIKEKLNIKINVNVDKSRIRPAKSEVNHLLSNNTKAKKILNWQPDTVGKKGFEKGISKTIKWFSKKDNLKLYESFDNYNV